MHATLHNLPPEILHLIIASTLSGEPVPSNILRVNRHFHNAGVEWLYKDLRFRSQEQLKLFAQTSDTQTTETATETETETARVAVVPPRSVTVDLTGKYATSDVWRYLCDALSLCRDRGVTQKQKPKQILMEFLCLRLHSYSQDCSHHLLEEALSVTKWVER